MSLTTKKKKLGSAIKVIIWFCPIAAMFSQEPVKILLAGGYTYLTAKYSGFLGGGSVIGSELDSP